MPRLKAGAPATDAPDMEAPTLDSAPARAAARVLSVREAEKLKGDLADLIQDAGDYLDYSLSHLNRNGGKSDIWAFDDEEASTLAGVWISRGRKSARAAAFIRYVVSQWAYVQVAMMLGGRFVETVAFMADNGGMVAPSFVKRSSRPRRVAPSATPAPAPHARATATPPTPTPAPAPAPVDDTVAAEARQRAHMAQVAASRDTRGAAQAIIAASAPDSVALALEPTPQAEEASA